MSGGELAEIRIGTVTPSQRDVRPLPPPGRGTPMPRLDRRELDEEWRLRAACKGKTELFFFNGQIQGYEYDAARLICRACPVLAECANWVLTAPPLLGFVAGMTERERKRARRSRRTAA